MEPIKTIALAIHIIGGSVALFTGLFNMVFIIPTITLFQQRTPQRLMGRVISSRDLSGRAASTIRSSPAPAAASTAKPAG